MMIQVLTFLCFTAVGLAGPLPDAAYAAALAGTPYSITPGTYEMTNAKPGLVFSSFDDVTWDFAGVTIKPTENVTTPISINGGTRTTGGSYTTRLQATGLISAGTTQLECQYITGEPVVSLTQNQTLRTTSTFTLVNPVGCTICYWIWGSSPGTPTVGGIFLKPGNGSPTSSPEFYMRGQGTTYVIMGAGVTLAAGGAAFKAGSPSVENSQWNFVAAYFDQAANELGISINGGAFQTAATTGTWTAAASPTSADIGKNADLAGRNAKLSNMWLWKGRVLSLAEVQAIYNSGVGMRYTDLSAGQKTDLLYAWELNEAAGATREDSHGSNDLTEAVGGPIAQYTDGWTGSVDQPLTNVFSVGDRCIITCGVSIADAQEPKYSVFREISAISGHTVTFSQPFPVACENFVDSATMEAQGADPQKTGAWGGDGDAAPYLHPFSAGPNTIGYAQRGWGTSHDIHLFAGGHPNNGLTLQNLTLDWTSSTHKRNGTTAVYAGFAENVRFENLTTIRHRGYNSVLFDRCGDSGVDGYTMTGDATGAIFADDTDYVVSACALWSGENIYFRNVDIRGNGILLCNAEAGSINAVMENVRLVGGNRVPPQPSFGVHFGSYAAHFQGSEGGVLGGIAFRNIYLDTPSDPNTRILYYTSNSAGFTVENITYPSGEFSDATEFRRLSGYIRVGNRIFGPRTALVHNFSVVFDGSGGKTATMPTGLYAAWPVLTLDTRDNLSVVSPSNAANLLTYIPSGTSLDFGTPATGGMQVWDRGGHGPTLDQLLAAHYIAFAPSGSLTATRNYTLTATYFPEVTNDHGPRFHIQPSPGGTAGLLDKNGNKISL